jgi:hypothetical protein
MTKNEIIQLLKTDVKEFNRWRQSEYKKNNYKLDLSFANFRNVDCSNADFRNADCSNADFCYANFRNVDCSNSDFSNADLDFSELSFSCKSLSSKFDCKHIIQILYHAAKPCENNYIKLDPETKKLLNSKMFKKVINKFHRVGECGIYTGVKEEKGVD